MRNAEDVTAPNMWLRLRCCAATAYLTARELYRRNQVSDGSYGYST